MSQKFEKELEQLGHRLFVFQRACNQLYQQSVKGKQPAWVARYLDAGKPPELVEFSRRKEFRDDLPKVIRPDLVLTDEGYTIAEIDSVPGGIGLTAWLNQTYANLGSDVIGGSDGMFDGFRTVLPNGGDIVVSNEAGTYRPEMQWLSAQLTAKYPGSQWKVFEAENYEPQNGRDVYRFFELFDLPNLPRVGELMKAAADKRVTVTPPFKPYLEEKIVVRTFLAATAAGILAARTRRKIFPETAGGHSLHVVPRPDAVAATRRHPAPGDSRLA